MDTKELLNIYNEIQNELLTDIDMSGGLYLEYQNFTKNGK
jgi:hypothetical protein